MPRRPSECRAGTQRKELAFAGRRRIAAQCQPDRAVPPDGSLSLALGVAIAEGLETFISDPVKLKWPNDLVAQDRKLGGILVETSTQGRAETRVVAGLGVNIHVSEEQRDRVAAEGGLEPTGLSELDKRKQHDPNVLAAVMITAIAGVLESHPVDGFDRWADGWNGRDWLAESESRRIAAPIRTRA